MSEIQKTNNNPNVENIDLESLENLENFVNNLLEKYNHNRSYLIEMAFDIQEYFGYIPKELLEILCNKLNIFYSEAYSSIFFFKDFKDKKSKKIVVSVCNGTSCYFNGGKQVHEKLIENFKENPNVEIKTSYCYKCCAQYPVVAINNKILPNISYDKLKNLLDNY